MTQWKINNMAAGNEAELLIYGDIGVDWFGEGNDPKAFAQAISQITAPVLNIRINSYGGDLFAGQAIHSIIKSFTGTKKVYIDGIAASAASIIAMAGDEVIMPANAMLMIHNAFTAAYGDSEDFKKLAADMEKMNTAIVASYQKKTGMDEAKLKEMMNAETWLTAKEAVEMGFADTLVDAMEIAAKLDGNKFFINGVSMPALPAQMLKQFVNTSISKTQEVNPMEGTTLKPLTIEALKRDQGDIYNAIHNEAKTAGIKAERERINSIREMALPGYENILNTALENGASLAEFLTDQTKAVKAKAAESTQQAQQHMQNIQSDAAELDAVIPTGAPATKIDNWSKELDEAKTLTKYL